METNVRKIFIHTYHEQNFPLYIETVGLNLHQEPIHRKRGYPYFHWLQTYEGQGELMFSGKKFILDKNEGVLLYPQVPHSYWARTEKWATLYITFDGLLVRPILASFGLRSAIYQMDHASRLSGLLQEIILEADRLDYTSLDGSVNLYKFIVHLKKYGQAIDPHAYSKTYNKLEPLLLWLEHNYGDSSIGLETMSQYLGVSPQHLNFLFRKTFGLSPYLYLIRLRINKSKELLMTQREKTIKSISQLVGFQDTSYFISFFRKMEGMTPGQFRELMETS